MHFKEYLSQFLPPIFFFFFLVSKAIKIINWVRADDKTRIKTKNLNQNISFVNEVLCICAALSVILLWQIYLALIGCSLSTQMASSNLFQTCIFLYHDPKRNNINTTEGTRSRSFKSVLAMNSSHSCKVSKDFRGTQ